MAFDFDPQKSQQNLKHHGIDFESAQELWGNPHVIIPAKNVSGENRSAILGTIGKKVYMGIFTVRGDKTRLISCHRADKKWERIFYGYLQKSPE